MYPTYGLLFAAFIALYLPGVPIRAGRVVPPWQLLLLAAIASGLFQGVVSVFGALALAGLWAATFMAVEAQAPEVRRYARLASVLLAMALALHLIPGFTNLVVAQDVRLTDNSAAMTVKANFDKGAAGLLLLAYFCRRPDGREWPRVLSLGVVVGAATAALVIGLVAALGPIRFDPKWSPLALDWMPINLFLTCVFEEVLFRGLLQQSLSDALRHRPQLRWVPICVASLLFGIVHVAGGPALIAAAALAGFGYGSAYMLTGRIESAVISHFMLNAAHFFLFTYPYAAR
jgi:membrane protease YdiL (CAAX protease family)